MSDNKNKSDYDSVASIVSEDRFLRFNVGHAKSYGSVSKTVLGMIGAVPKDIDHVIELVNAGVELRMYLNETNYETIDGPDLTGWLSRDGKEDIPILIAAGRLRYVMKEE